MLPLSTSCYLDLNHKLQPADLLLQHMLISKPLEVIHKLKICSLVSDCHLARMASRTQLRNASLHVRLTQILRDIVHRTIGETQVASSIQKMVGDESKTPEPKVSAKPPVQQETGTNSPQDITPPAREQSLDVSSWQNYMSLLKIPEKPQPKVVPKWKLEIASTRVCRKRDIYAAECIVMLLRVISVL